MTMAYTIPEARKVMGLGTTRIYEEIASGRLRAKKAGRRTLIPAESIDQWLKALPDFPVAHPTN